MIILHEKNVFPYSAISFIKEGFKHSYKLFSSSKNKPFFFNVNRLLWNCFKQCTLFHSFSICLYPYNYIWYSCEHVHLQLLVSKNIWYSLFYEPGSLPIQAVKIGRRFTTSFIWPWTCLILHRVKDLYFSYSVT